MSDKFNNQHRAILVDKQVVLEPDLIKWAKSFETSDRRVAKNDVGDFYISTVFLGLNYQYSDDEPALWFETMVFSKSGQRGESFFERRYATYDEALKGHHSVVNQLQEGAPVHQIVLE